MKKLFTWTFVASIIFVAAACTDRGREQMQGGGEQGQEQGTQDQGAMQPGQEQQPGQPGQIQEPGATPSPMETSGMQDYGGTVEEGGEQNGMAGSGSTGSGS